MDITRHTTNLKQFRSSLYQNINNRADSLMNLLDAMCSVPNARSVVEYSLAACYLRSYSTIFKAINEMNLAPMWLPYQLVPYLPRPKKWPFWLLMADVTPGPRPYAHTLEDRGMVYQPEVVKGKLPVTIGHQYSTVALGLEPEAGVSSSWALPLLTERVESSEDKEMVGSRQIEMLLRDAKLPFTQDLTVEVGDSSYSKPTYLHAHRKFPNLVTEVRVRGNRMFYQQYVSTKSLSEKSSGAKDDPGAGEVEHRFVVFNFLLPANQQPAKTIQPGLRAFHQPSAVPVARNMWFGPLFLPRERI
jgi:hypothetical protein